MSNPIDQLVDAAHRDNTVRMQKLLDDGVPIDGVGSQGCTPLQAAAANARAHAFQLLLERGADVNAVGTTSTRPAHFILLRSEVGDPLPLFKQALTAGAELRVAPDILREACFDAIRREAPNATVLEKLLASGASANPPIDPTIKLVGANYPLLHFAAIQGNPAACAVLVRAGVDVDLEDARGIRPLTVALAFDKERSVRALVALGANTHGFMSTKAKLDALLTTPPVRLAVESKNIDIVMCALERHRPDDDELQQCLQIATATSQARVVKLLRSWIVKEAAHQAIEEATSPVRAAAGARP